MRNTLWCSIALFVLVCSEPSAAQSPPATPKPTPARAQRKSGSFLRNIVEDQKAIWTSPFRLSGEHARWAIPATLGLAGLIATDRRTSSAVPRGGNLGRLSSGVSWGGSIFTDAGVAAGFYLIGRSANNARARETGTLIAESLVDSEIVVTVLKNTTRRLRPNFDNGSGRFFDGGRSFPSGHSAGVWSTATIIALEYRDKPVIKYSALAAAVTVSAARYTGREHFLSDIAVGSAIGIYTGRFVFKRRHHTSHDHADEPVTTRLLPMLVPSYDRRSASYGLKAVWRL